jgi:uncharacterized cupin superfamily protein
MTAIYYKYLTRGLTLRRAISFSGDEVVYQTVEAVDPATSRSYRTLDSFFDEGAKTKTVNRGAWERWADAAHEVLATGDVNEAEGAFDAAADAAENAERVETVIEAIEAEAEAPTFSPGDRVYFPYRGFAGYGEVVQSEQGNVKVRVLFYSTPKMRVAVAARPVIAYPASDLTPAA